jgi:aspartyl-tRNA synthetase
LTSLRTHTCGELRAQHVGQEVALAGWVQSIRDHGGVLFADLRDRYGITQVVFNPERSPELHRRAGELRSEYVIRIQGKVRRRPEGTANPKVSTGEIEVPADSLDVLNASETPAFEIDENVFVSEERRLEYRYLDLRRGPLLRNLLFRDQACTTIRNYLHGQGFVEVETPMLTRSTPEGARDYIVPSRLNPGNFYALPQSPQLFKQLMMVGGLDRYFQMARCFRDEDLRADRQPEFTQLDIEMSFVTEEDVIRLTEGLMAAIFRENMGIQIKTPLPRLTYDKAVARFGCDRPDLRFGMELVDISDLAGGCEFRVFRQALDARGQVKGLCVSGGADLSRADLDALTEKVCGTGAKGLAWFKVVEGAGLSSQISKFFGASLQEKIIERFGARDGDLLLCVADAPRQVAESLCFLRQYMAGQRGRIPQDEFCLCWVVNFPLLEYNEQEKRLQSLHHPFTHIAEGDLHRLETDPLSVRARAYDIVLNGIEIGGGSIRIHDTQVQCRVFKALGIGEEEAEEKFGFLLKALRYGAPPHGGIAFGFDRICRILLGLESIRDVIAFPKTQKAFCPLTLAPSSVEEQQLRELGIKLRQEGA